MPEHAAVNPVSSRTLRLTGFRRHLTPEDMAEFVKPLLGNTSYENITAVRPRDGEARVIFKTNTERDTFKAAAMTGANPTCTDATTGEATKLYWHLPETKDDKHRSYIVRRLRDSLPVAFPEAKFEVNQRTGTIYANELPLLTVYIDTDTSAAKARIVDRTLENLAMGKDTINGLIRKANVE
jgi:hypothetical protein